MVVDLAGVMYLVLCGEIRIETIVVVGQHEVVDLGRGRGAATHFVVPDNTFLDAQYDELAAVYVEGGAFLDLGGGNLFHVFCCFVITNVTNKSIPCKFLLIYFRDFFPIVVDELLREAGIHAHPNLSDERASAEDRVRPADAGRLQFG